MKPKLELSVYGAFFKVNLIFRKARDPSRNDSRGGPTLQLLAGAAFSCLVPLSISLLGTASGFVPLLPHIFTQTQPAP